MGRRDLLSTEERRHLFGVPVDRDALARLYTFGPADLSLIEARREERNRLGFAIQLALLRHPGMTLAQIAAQPGVDLEPLASFIAGQLELPSAALADYAAREQTMVSMQKAQIGFQAAVTVRNKLVSAYTDIMNMPV